MGWWLFRSDHIANLAQLELGLELNLAKSVYFYSTSLVPQAKWYFKIQERIGMVLKGRVQYKTIFYVLCFSQKVFR